jgi:uncharacterized protein YdiU (UPF0061 family)
LDTPTLATPLGAEIFAGNRIPAGADPMAQAYAGHQFGNFTRLGDGRAILLGEQVTPEGLRFDVQLKGSGPTDYSRRGDGRATLGPMLREYVISEAMHALGVPTTRSLAVTATGEDVARDRILPGAVLTRVAASHIRVGTFEFAANFTDLSTLESLTRYTLARHYPEAVGSSDGFALALLEAVVDRQAQLIAKWMLLGFVHGVMNTDNMALCGETIDYGPCAFLDTYDPSTVFSSIDQQGRYAYGNQPQIAQWNLARFAETLLPLIDSDQKRAIDVATERLARFGEEFRSHWLAGMRAKLGILNENEPDLELIQSLLQLMQDSKADFTRTFRALTDGDSVEPALADKPAYQEWTVRWEERLATEPGGQTAAFERMKSVNPVVIPRNYQVEQALNAAVEEEDMTPVNRLLEVVTEPYSKTARSEAYETPPVAGGAPYRTYCGT